jgi:lipopolysaccharide/colanic/teichoic acid biosynthesis glycosyltransferase
MDAALSQRITTDRLMERRPQSATRDGRASGRVAATATSEPTSSEVEVPVPLALAGDLACPLPAATHRIAEPSESTELAIRLVNVTVAIVGLVLLLPVLLAVALAVKLTSRGPVFYTQTRVGVDRRWRRRRASADHRQQDLGGRPFTIYKFRSMTVDAEREGRAVWATRNDARVTPVGRVIRRTRLDELPQLLNVIRGDMNIVGPRPERPSIFAQLRQDIPDYPLRQRARPGITGWAQINQAYDSCIDDVRRKVQYDLEYLERRGVAEDIRIMLKTIPVMLFKRGGW